MLSDRCIHVCNVVYIGGGSRVAPGARAPLEILHTSCAPPSSSYTTARTYTRSEIRVLASCAREY